MKQHYNRAHAKRVPTLHAEVSKLQGWPAESIQRRTGFTNDFSSKFKFCVFALCRKKFKLVTSKKFIFLTLRNRCGNNAQKRGSISSVFAGFDLPNDHENW